LRVFLSSVAGNQTGLFRRADFGRHETREGLTLSDDRSGISLQAKNDRDSKTVKSRPKAAFL
jgi:hypothetical protein